MRKYWWQIAISTTLFIITAKFADRMVRNVDWMTMPKEIPWGWIAGIVVTIVVLTLLVKHRKKILQFQVSEDTPKKFWGVVKPVLQVLVVIVVGWFLYGKYQESQVVKAERQAAWCRENPFAERCFPADTTITFVVKRGEVRGVPVPPWYYFELYAKCAEVKLEEKREGRMLWLVTSLREGADSALVETRVFRNLHDPYTRREGRCEVALRS